MKYNNIVEGKFIERPNRFIAICDIDGVNCRAHVKNTGRCRELLVPGSRIWLEDHVNCMGTRKLRYSLISVEKEGRIINMDSQAPNKVVEEGIKEGILSLPGNINVSVLEREKKYGDSRFDFYFETVTCEKGYIEVKGVTLENGNIAYFPDAPTERGLKHIRELEKAVGEGYLAAIIFVVQIKGIEEFRPNDVTQPEFGKELKAAEKKGVKIMAVDCNVSHLELKINGGVRVKIPQK